MRFIREEVARKQTGTRLIYGTEYPVETICHKIRDCFRSKPYWVVTYDLCNGTPRRDEKFTKKSAAMTMFKLYTSAKQ